jgi:hypothetical protein
VCFCKKIHGLERQESKSFVWRDVTVEITIDQFLVRSQHLAMLTTILKKFTEKIRGSQTLYPSHISLKMFHEPRASLRPNRVARLKLQEKTPLYKEAWGMRVSVTILATLRTEYRLSREVLNPVLPREVLCDTNTWVQSHRPLAKHKHMARTTDLKLLRMRYG